MLRMSHRWLVASAWVAGAALVAVPGVASAEETSPTSCTIELDGDTLYDESSSITGTLTFDQFGWYEDETVVDGVVTSRYKTDVVQLENTMVLNWSIVFEGGSSPTTSFGQRFYAVDGVTPLCSYTVQWGGTPPTSDSVPGPTSGGSPMLPETGSGMTPVLVATGVLLAVGSAMMVRRRRPA